MICMKRIYVFLLFATLLFVLTSCGEGGTNMLLADNKTIADNTMGDIVDAINQKDSSKIVKLFSISVQKDDELLQNASEMIDFIKGEITVASSDEIGVFSRTEQNKGKNRKLIESSFCIETTESKYYVAVKECLKDEFDGSNTGIVAICIIESVNWTQESLFRGDGQLNEGIVIITEET